MGHQQSSQSNANVFKRQLSLQRLPRCKTNFHYIHPLSCDVDQNMQQQYQQKAVHQAQYWQLQKEPQYQQSQTAKDLQNLEEIKVKWNTFIKMKKRNYLEDYSVLKQIGRGGFGCVHKVKARYTGLYRAAKRIKKGQLSKDEHAKLFEEMAIMMSLDHPNVAKLYQVYDYKSYYVLILQLCEGGQLFKKIVTKQITQQFAGRIMKQIFRTLIYLHKKNVVHRDLKPQNMLFELDSDMIKIIDFGIAVRKKPNQILNTRLGTPYYIAPEVLCKSYDEKCDIWSAGVILFMMICSYPPFRGDNQFQVMENVLKQGIQFKGVAWNKTSSDCKSLITWMLKKNPQQRPSAYQAFNHPWIKKFIDPQTGGKQSNILRHVRGFNFQNKLQAVVYTYIVSQLLTSEQKKFLIQTFKQLDVNNDGVIDTKQLHNALKQNNGISQQRATLLMRVIDTNDSGQIDYTEFLVAGLNTKEVLNAQHFQQAFQYFDIDHSGEITFQEIAHFLQDTKQSQESIKKIFMLVDQDNDGTISKEQFIQLLLRQTKMKIKSMEEGSKEPLDNHKEQEIKATDQKQKPNDTKYISTQKKSHVVRFEQKQQKQNREASPSLKAKQRSSKHHSQKKKTLKQH